MAGDRLSPEARSDAVEALKEPFQTTHRVIRSPGVLAIDAVLDAAIAMANLNGYCMAGHPVGVSTCLSSRLRSHRRRWGDLILKITWEEHPDEASMFAAETLAIREEYPALNIAGVE